MDKANIRTYSIVHNIVLKKHRQLRRNREQIFDKAISNTEKICNTYKLNSKATIYCWSLINLLCAEIYVCFFFYRTNISPKEHNYISFNTGIYKATEFATAGNRTLALVSLSPILNRCGIILSCVEKLPRLRNQCINKKVCLWIRIVCVISVTTHRFCYVKALANDLSQKTFCRMLTPPEKISIMFFFQFRAIKSLRNFDMLLMKNKLSKNNE